MRNRQASEQSRSRESSAKFSVGDSGIRVPEGDKYRDVQDNRRPKVAYAITVTRDGHFVDGALVLGFAAHKYHDAKRGFPSKYEVDLVAFVAPNVVTSRPILEANGWRVLEKGLPVPLDEIENRDYAEKVANSGCCGADEFLKLWAFTLTEYHRVTHLDMDSIIFQNMDELYEIDKEVLFTGDYNMKGGSPVVPAQGGFLVVRPSMDTFREFQSIIRKGDHSGKGVGGISHRQLLGRANNPRHHPVLLSRQTPRRCTGDESLCVQLYG